MSNKIFTIGTIVLFATAIIFSIGCSSDGNKADTKLKSSHADAHDHSVHAGYDHEKKSEPSGHSSMGGTMKAALTADKLYDCPMCKGVVSADADTPCPICKMKLVPMDDKKMANLKASHPKGCPMCAIVFEGGSQTENCPVCKMKLSVIR